MTIYIGHASYGENGGYNNQPGDQTGGEVCIREWYDKPWQYVIRCKDANKADQMASFMEKVCENDNIGYDMGDRLTLYNQLKAHNWDVSQVEKCEVDCSSLIAVCCQSVGYNVYQSATTRNLRPALVNTGAFDVYSDDEYIHGVTKLRRGDILLTEGSHTAMCLTTYEGEPVVPVVYDKKYTVLTALNLRAVPSGKIVCVMPQGAEVLVADISDGWARAKYGVFTGYCSVKYIKAVEDDSKDNDKDTTDTDIKDEDTVVPLSNIKYVTTTGVYMREGPAKTYSIICSLPKNSDVVGFEMCGGWIHCTHGRHSGYVSSSYLKENNEVVTPTPTVVETTKKYRTTTALNMRVSAGIFSKKVCVIPGKVEVEYSGDVKKVLSTDWYRVTYNGKTGYISSKYVKEV